jgi:ribosomal protein S18 acetylase RimI-like enzyme
MTINIQRLSLGDEAVLRVLAVEDADFDLDGRAGARKPLDDTQARDFLANPAVLLWVASDADQVLGFLYCVVVPLRSDDARELLLYEIGVRKHERRQGVGRALLAHMEAWMAEAGIKTVWVLADNPGAVTFYKSCAFIQEAEQPVYLTREVT